MIQKKKSIHLFSLKKIRDFYSPTLERIVDVDIFLPPDYEDVYTKYPFLILNDGQDSTAVKVRKHLSILYSLGRIEPVIVIGVYAGDRMQEYGVQGHPDYRERGASSAIYNDFIIEELIPFIKDNFRINTKHPRNAIAGYSLGGLSALDICWNNPDVFKRVGVFSGSLWWRSKSYDDGYTDDDRIMHQVIKKGTHKKGLRFWFEVGGKDETADRNENGVIDSIDDTLDMISELIQKGYKPYRDIEYLEIKNGYHTQVTWAKAMPYFLQWAFSR